MKFIKNIKLGALLVCGIISTSSCEKYLDVNTDPDNPTAESATYYARLAWCQFYMNDAQMFAGYRNSGVAGDLCAYEGRNYAANMAYWNYSGTNSAVTTPYQWFFVGCGSNLQDMYEKGMAAEAYHYAGAAKLLRAYGFMLMTDLYGEMPYEEGLGQSATPAFSTGKTIFKGCMEDIDEAIELFQKPQKEGTKSLAEGDSWNGGDVNKWLKMAYLFKARWINHLLKKGAGSYKDLKYDADAILDCLAKAQASNADNTVINHTDANTTSHDVLGWDEPVDYSPLYSVNGMNSNYWYTETTYKNLTNFGGYGVEDPRADHILPWAYCNGKSVPAYAEGKIKYTGKWRRTLGVDINDIAARSQGMPVSTQWSIKDDNAKYAAPGSNGAAGFFFNNSATEDRWGDTVYVAMTSSSKGYAANKDLLYRRNTAYDNSAFSGTFFTRVSAPTWVACYHEVCFLKAETLFRKGDKAGAFAAYKEGIKANIELMNSKLKVWVAEDPSLTSCPSFTPMNQADIDAYLNNGIGTASDITLAKIMTQKHIAMMFQMENYNDARRLDYKDFLLNWNIPASYTQNTTGTMYKYIPQGKQPRRWRQCSHELNYNATNLQAIGSEVPGADMSVEKWNAADDVWTIPVWWDSDQQ